MSKKSTSKSSAPMIIIVAIVLIAVAAYFYLQKDETPPSTSQVLPPATVVPDAEPELPKANEPVPHFEPPVVVDATPQEPLPELNASDEGALAAIGALRGDSLVSFIMPQEVLRKFVLAVNGIAEGKVVSEYRVIKSPPPPFIPEKFSVTVGGEVAMQERVSTQNFARYNTYVTALSLLETDAVVAMYKCFYPLLEEAYGELGLSKGNFHSVLIAAIDNILAAPEVSGDMILIQPKVFYQFADPVLEKMPSTHKLMARMGPENAQTVKASLRRLRVKLLSDM